MDFLCLGSSASIGKINVFNFSEEALERAGMPGNTPGASPFQVVSSNILNEKRISLVPPEYWPERVYSWGTCEAFNVEHSDLLSLRALLTTEGLEEIIREKEKR